MKGTLKLWDYVGNMPDKVHEAMVECLQAFRTVVHCQRSGDLVKSKVSPFKVR